MRQLIRATSDRIAGSERRIERQRQLIAGLAEHGDDTVLAERELADPIEGNEQLKGNQSTPPRGAFRRVLRAGVA
jgi:hypothetical protein